MLNQYSIMEFRELKNHNNFDEPHIIGAVRDGQFEDALRFWRDSRQGVEICSLSYCENTPHESICCAYHLQGWLLSFSITNPENDHYHLAIKLGKWIKKQEIRKTINKVSKAKSLELPSSLVIGHPTIDYDHRSLLKIINHIGEALEDGDYATCRQLIDSFLKLSETHFQKEETILGEAGFQQLTGHREFHSSLLKKGGEFIKIGQDLEKSALARERLFNEMASFLLEDAIRADLEFQTFLAKRGRGGVGSL